MQRLSIHNLQLVYVEVQLVNSLSIYHTCLFFARRFFLKFGSIILLRKYETPQSTIFRCVKCARRTMQIPAFFENSDVLVYPVVKLSIGWIVLLQDEKQISFMNSNVINLRKVHHSAEGVELTNSFISRSLTSMQQRGSDRWKQRGNDRRHLFQVEGGSLHRFNFPLPVTTLRCQGLIGTSTRRPECIFLNNKTG